MAIYSPVGTPITPLPTPEEGSISPPLDLSPKEINPQARELLQAERVAADPLAQFEKVEPNFFDAGGAKPIDLNAREKLGGFADPLAQFEKVPTPPPIPGFEKADDLDVYSVDELTANRKGFNPVTYFSENPPTEDPKKLAKLIEVARRRYDEGFNAGEVAGALFSKGTGKTLGEAATSAPVTIVERGVDLLIQPTANVILGTLSGDLFNKQRREALFNETRKIVKKSGSETSGGIESATVGLVDLSRQGIRKLDTAYTPLPLSAMGEGAIQEEIPIKKPLTDQEVLERLSDDASFRQNAEEILKGQGETAKTLGLDKETLAKQGIEIDPEAIRLISLVDPVTMVATGGAFKLVGLGGKVLATAKTIQGAEKVAEGLSKLAKLPGKAAGRLIQGSGKLATLTGESMKKTSTFAGVGSMMGGSGTIEGVATAAAVNLAGEGLKKIGPKIASFGKSIAEGAPLSLTAQKIIDYAKIPGRAAATVGRGALSGFVAGAPFAVMADDDEVAGTLLGVGAGLGAAGGAGAVGAGAFRVVKGAAARRYFGENRPVLENIESPGYGDAPSDALHETQLQKLSMQDVSEINNFREVLRPLGKKILAVDRPTFRKKASETYPDASPEQLDIFEGHSAIFDSKDTVYLNSDAKGLRHDAGHLFDALLTPEKRVELREAITDAFGQKSIDDFKATYKRRSGSDISDAAALDEYVAEQFNALFHNVPITEMNAPKGLLNKFIDTAAEGAELLGIDLTGGAKTPLVGGDVSVGIRKLFQNAAGEVTRRSVEAKTAPAPAPAPPVTPPRPSADIGTLPADFYSTFPGGPATPPAPAAPVPPVAPAPVAPNIRVTPEQTAAFTRTATPDARAAAAARSAETGVDYARSEAKKVEGSPTSLVIEQISNTMESGRPVVSIEHLGITSKSTPAAPAGRTPRRGEQAGGYAALEAAQIDVRQNAPPEIVALHSKNFVPVRWTNQGGTPTLIAMSLDKVISNILKIAADPKAKDLIPYAVEKGKLTTDGWREVVADAQAYSENQANGRKGDGGRLAVPEAGLSIPAENPAYVPKPLSPERANFQNLVQGLATPKTNRAQAGVMPGNIKGQLLAEANQRAVELPVKIPTKQAGKQAFVEFPPRVVQEVNPLRNAMEARGVKTRELLEVTERIRAKDIVSAKERPDVAYKAPVTDIIRGGFAPAPTEFRQKNLGGRTVEEFSDYVLKSSPEEWKAATENMTGGLTGGAWNLGLGLKDAADVSVLKSFQDSTSEATKAAMKSGDFDSAYSLVGKGQFFREAYEAATGTGSAGAAFKRGTAGMESAKPPFPITKKD